MASLRPRPSISKRGRKPRRLIGASAASANAMRALEAENDFLRSRNELLLETVQDLLNGNQCYEKDGLSHGEAFWTPENVESVLGCSAWNALSHYFEHRQLESNTTGLWVISGAKSPSAAETDYVFSKDDRIANNAAGRALLERKAETELRSIRRASKSSGLCRSVVRK